MPNHVTNLLTINGSEERVKEILEYIKNDEIGVGSIDFNKITPKPPWVWDEGPLGQETESKYGTENCWYNWNIKNWGTKWNSYGYDDKMEFGGGNTIEFLTAWSGVRDLTRKLSLIFKDVTIEYKWADEDIGQNVGHEHYQDGECIFENIPTHHSKESYDMAFEIQGSTAEDYSLVYDESEQTYVFKEDEVTLDM